jgi:histidinol-phosphate aminotransferase
MAISRRTFFHQSAVSAFSGATITLRNGLACQVALTRTVEPTGVIRLDNNENAYGPCTSAIEAMRESLSLANRYPDLEYKQLSEAVAELHGIRLEQVVLGCGSSEILRMAATAFLGPGKKLVLASPTFDLISEEARKLNAEVITVPLTKTYAHDLDAMRAHIRASAGLVYICNPNNPTGSLTPRKDLEEFLLDLPPEVVVVIDEAYHHYAGKSLSYASFLDRPVGGDRAIVTRTFSAIYGLAGLRIGYAVAAPQAARQLYGVRLQSSVNIVGARAAMASLGDSQHVRACSQRNANDRQEFYNMANARMLRVLDSHTNFVMLKTERHGSGVIEHFSKNNIQLGAPVPAMVTYVRVSLGTPTEMKEFWRVWDLMPAPREMSM